MPLVGRLAFLIAINKDKKKNLQIYVLKHYPDSWKSHPLTERALGTVIAVADIDKDNLIYYISCLVLIDSL